MITNPIVLCILVACAVLLAAAALAPFVVPFVTERWQKATPLGRFVFIFALSIAALYGGSKTNDVDDAGASVTNRLMGLARRFMAPVFRSPTVTPEEVARGWQVVSVETNASISYVMPDGAALATNWWVRGAYEDVTPVGGLWAFTWGKVRFALGDAAYEIAAVGAPMSAVPFLSRLWSATTTNDSLLVTWEDFAAGRDTNTPVSAQLEFRADGNCIARSNDVETALRRIDPNDFDGDGYLNGDDPYPYAWDDGAELFYGPQGGLPTNCNASAYCDVTVEIDGTNSQWVTFAGDGPSDYADPGFRAKPGVPYDVKILIGKTYRVTCDAPIRCTGGSSGSIQVRNADTNAFTVVWPVSITEAPAPLFAPPPGLLGAPSGGRGFSLSISPDWLNGIVSWPTNLCCQIVNNNGLYGFSCQDGCACGGCTLTGAYLYEGYSLAFGGIHCGCRYTANDNTTFGLATPSVVFRDGALRPISVSFHHGDEDERERGTLTLAQIGGSGKVRIWTDEERTAEATQFSWNVSSFDGCTYYLEGVETSGYVNDIRFRLTWERPDGTTSAQTASTTCAEVLRTEVTSLTSGIADGSSNPQPFAGHTNWEFDVTHSPNPDKHFAVLYRDAVNTNDFSVRDFTIQMSLVVRPSSAPVGTASWLALDPTPESGSVVGSGPRTGELRNPKVGGVYHIASFFDGSPTNECNIVLPLAGAAIDDILEEDLRRADEFAAAVRRIIDEKHINTVEFGLFWFWDSGRGDYLGRADNLDTPTVWPYNQVTTSGLQFGKGSVATLGGLPIRISKISNLLAAYTCERLGVYQVLQDLSQWIGTRNDDSSRISWACGTDLSCGSNYVHSVSNMVRACWHSSDTKAPKLWPNTNPADNHAAAAYYGDVERFFYSPGMLYVIRH